MKRIILAILMVFIILPAHALDVSAVDGRAQVGATLNSLQAKVNALMDAVSVTSTSLTQTIQDLAVTQAELDVTEADLVVTKADLVATQADLVIEKAKVVNLENCGDQSKIWDKSAGVCVAPDPPVGDDLDKLNCPAGYVIVNNNAGNPKCIDPSNSCPCGMCANLKTTSKTGIGCDASTTKTVYLCTESGWKVASVTVTHQDSCK